MVWSFCQLMKTERLYGYSSKVGLVSFHMKETGGLVFGLGLGVGLWSRSRAPFMKVFQRIKIRA